MGRGRRRLHASLGVALAVLVTAAAPAAAAPPRPDLYVDWPALLPPLPAPHTPNVEPDCADGDDACIDRTIAEMERRFHAVVPPCDHDAVFSLAYLRVTEDVRDAIRTGVFSDRVWLAQEDAVFARMYFEAYDRWADGERAGVPPAWRIAFDAAHEREMSALGDFLLAMNAHINRDFPLLLASIGITAPDGTSRKPDHDAYNVRLAALYRPVLKEIAARFDPTADDAEAGPADDVLAATVLQSWREGVWRNAERLVLARDESARRQVVREIELEAAAIGAAIRATFRGDPGPREVWCAEHGGQDPSRAPSGEPAPASRAAVARISSVRVARSRAVRVGLACPDGPAACRGTVALERRGGRGPALRRVGYRIAAGSAGPVTLPLSARARRLVRADGGRARLTLRRTGVAERRAVTRRSLRIR